MPYMGIGKLLGNSAGPWAGLRQGQGKISPDLAKLLIAVALKPQNCLMKTPALLLIILSLLVVISVNAAPISEKELTKYLEMFVRGTVPANSRNTNQKTEFSTDECRKPVAEMMKVLLLGTQYTQNYKFAPGCDVQGTVIYQKNPFKVDLSTRNSGPMDRIFTMAQYEVSPNMDGTIDIEGILKSGRAYSKGVVLGEFSARYSVVFSLAGELIENKGGVVKITSLQNKKVNISYPFKSDFIVKTK
jgi:hypothetical protein